MRPRPRYESTTPLPRETVRDHLDDALARGSHFAGKVSDGRIDLRIAESERHLWSPFITLEFVDQPAGTKLQGYFGPHPHLWGLFVAVYATQGFLFLAGLVHGTVSYSLDQPVTGLWVAAVMLLSLGVSCALNIAGEWAGEPQMAAMRAFVAQAVNADEEAA